MTQTENGRKQSDAATRIVWVVVALVVVFMLVLFKGRPMIGPEGEHHFGLWSLAPAGVAIIIAFALRQVIPALFLGILIGGFVVGDLNIVDRYLLPQLGQRSYAMILLVYLWSLGGLIGLWTRTGGAVYFAEWVGKRIVRGPNSAKFFAWLLGILFHQGGTISTVLAGTTVRPIADRNRVSHEELSYMVDSTASPVATIIPFNAWPLYVGPLLATAIVTNGIPLIPAGADQDAAGVALFFQAIWPYNFYAIFAVLFTLLFAFGLLPFLPGKRMQAAIKRSREEGLLDRPGSEPLASAELTEVNTPPGYRPGMFDFVGPIGVLLGVAVLPYVVPMIAGRLGIDLGDPSLMIEEAFVLALLAAMTIALVKGMRLREVLEGFLSGVKGVTIGAVILGLAVTLNGVSGDLGTGRYVVDVLGEAMPAMILPAILMAACMLIAFSTGTSWGTYAVIIPMAVPLAWVVGGGSEQYLLLCLGGVIGGAVFGDQCSPISDTTILASLATGCDLMDHVYTQIPMALGAATLGAILSMILVAAGIVS